MALQFADILDLDKATLPDLGRDKITDLSFTLQRSPFMRKISKKRRVEKQSGDSCQWNMLVNDSGAAAHSGLFDTDSVNIMDGVVQASRPWRHSKVPWGFDAREPIINRGVSRIYDEMKKRRYQALVSAGKLFESTWWNGKSSSSDVLSPDGLPQFVVKNATLGFNGGNATTDTGGYGGVSATTYSAAQNYSGTYAATGGISKTDVITKLANAADLTEFQSPVDPNIEDYETANECELYMNQATLSAFRLIGEAQNENLGRDLDSMAGKLVFRGSPMIFASQLDADTQNPIYMLNWASIQVGYLSGRWKLESDPIMLTGAHNQIVNWVDWTWQPFCFNRRLQTVLYAA